MNAINRMVGLRDRNIDGLDAKLPYESLSDHVDVFGVRLFGH